VADLASHQTDLRWLRERHRREHCAVIDLARYRAVEDAVKLAANRHKVSDITRAAATALAKLAYLKGDSAARAVSRAYRVLAAEIRA
jgi:hypothetical protein